MSGGEPVQQQGRPFPLLPSPFPPCGEGTLLAMQPSGSLASQPGTSKEAEHSLTWQPLDKNFGARPGGCQRGSEGAASEALEGTLFGVPHCSRERERERLLGLALPSILCLPCPPWASARSPRPHSLAQPLNLVLRKKRSVFCTPFVTRLCSLWTVQHFSPGGGSECVLLAMPRVQGGLPCSSRGLAKRNGLNGLAALLAWAPGGPHSSHHLFGQLLALPKATLAL